MLSALLNNGVTLLAALLGKRKKIKHLRTKIYLVSVFCIAILVLIFFTNRSGDAKKETSPMIYVAPIYPMNNTPKDIEEVLNRMDEMLEVLNRMNEMLKLFNHGETEKKPIDNATC